MKKIIITSGYFNPIHIGHINYLKEAKKLGDILVVIVNNDEQVKIKGSVPFMAEQERMEIIKMVNGVDEVFLSIDKDRSVVESLKTVAKNHPGELIFANGGDRHAGNIPEVKVCEEFNIKMVDNVGGSKVQSSSWLLKNSSELKSKLL
ncbi:MAG: adenylyltransferase/cytidyltransferase family protein [Candidatus Staskawiczbacteria bacterium]|nr:adenylyltransferase/cytidyltransferase family protein [Candidatus Staskawiczbacteria bacterium]